MNTAMDFCGPYENRMLQPALKQQRFKESNGHSSDPHITTVLCIHMHSAHMVSMTHWHERYAMGLLEPDLETGSSEYVEANECDTTAQYPIEKPHQEDIACKNLYTRDRLTPYTQVSRSSNCPPLVLSEMSAVCTFRHRQELWAHFRSKEAALIGHRLSPRKP
jgi:hypothetical protein